MKLRSAPLDEIYNQFEFVLGTGADFESRITLAIGRLLYRAKCAFMLVALWRAARRGL